MKRFWIAVLAVAGVFGVLEMILHGVILEDLYLETASLWRSEEEVQDMIWLMGLGYLVFSFVFVVIFKKGYERNRSGVGQGFRFGFWAGLLVVGMVSMMGYVVMPIPWELATGWFFGGLGECMVAGMLAGKIYKPE